MDGFLRLRNTVVDEYLHTMTGADLKVYLYGLRRTEGFGKSADNISIGQFRNGITTKDGRRLDHGTGLSKNAVLAALRRLENMRLVTVQRANGKPSRYKFLGVQPVQKVNRNPPQKLHPQ